MYQSLSYKSNWPEHCSQNFSNENGAAHLPAPFITSSAYHKLTLHSRLMEWMILRFISNARVIQTKRLRCPLQLRQKNGTRKPGAVVVT